MNRSNHLHEKEQIQSLHANALIKKEKTIKYLREEVATSSNALRKRSLTLVNSVQHLSSLHKDEKNTVKELSTRVLELGKINDELQKEKSKALLNTPHALIARESNSRKGQKRWPLFIWEIILEQLVNGTCPSAIKANIVSIVSHFSPSTKIIELPSIWTMRRGRTVLLAVVQTLAAYRLAKLDKWEPY